MKLAKPHVDVGLYTVERDAMLAFWQERVGLPFQETLPAGRGVHQLRHGMNGSVMKINHSRDPLAEAGPSGYRELAIAREGLDAPVPLVDPDGNRVTLVPPGHDGVVGIGVTLAVRNGAAFHRFFSDGLGLEAEGDAAYRCGDSLLRFAEAGDVCVDPPLRARGFRYLTIQVHEVDVEHTRLLANGGREMMEPTTLGKVARISFVLDPDGNPIEISQRASLVGPV
jgi:lactoylglutathione lyase